MFGKETPDSRREPLGLYEISLENPASGETLSDEEVRERVARLRATGRPVLVTRFAETYQLTQYLKRYTDEPIRFALGLFNLMQIFHESYYDELDGGLVEAISRLMSADVRIYVMPMDADLVRARLESLADGLSLWELPDVGLATVENIEPTGRVRHLYRYLQEIGALVPLPGAG